MNEMVEDILTLEAVTQDSKYSIAVRLRAKQWLAEIYDGQRLFIPHAEIGYMAKVVQQIRKKARKLNIK